MANALIQTLAAIALGAGIGTLQGWGVADKVATIVAERGEAARDQAPPKERGAVVRELRPIITNLTAPEGVWARLEAALVYDNVDEKRADALSVQIAGDFLAFLRTVNASFLEGAAGLARLRLELSDRAAVRSDGLVKEVVIETVVIQ